MPKAMGLNTNQFFSLSHNREIELDTRAYLIFSLDALLSPGNACVERLRWQRISDRYGSRESPRRLRVIWSFVLLSTYCTAYYSLSSSCCSRVHLSDRWSLSRPEEKRIFISLCDTTRKAIRWHTWQSTPPAQQVESWNLVQLIRIQALWRNTFPACCGAE